MKSAATFLLVVLSLTSGVFAEETIRAHDCIVTYQDPKEPNVPAGKDVRELEIAVDGDVVQVRMSSYADWDLFFSNLKFTGGKKGQVSIGCYRNLFRVRVGEHPHASIQQKGIPFVKGGTYSFYFSWETAFGSSSEVKVRFWSPRDSAPDVKLAQETQSQLLTLRK